MGTFGGSTCTFGGVVTFKGEKEDIQLIWNSAKQLSCGDFSTLTEVDKSNRWIFWLRYGVKFVVATNFLVRGWVWCNDRNVVVILLGDDRVN